MTEIVTLADAKAHLRYIPGNTADDNAILGFITAATQVIIHEVGDCVPQSYDEDYNGGSYAIYTRHRPILSVELVQEGWGFINYVLDYQEVNSPSASSIYAYSIDDPDFGIISRRTFANSLTNFFPGSANIRVNYTAGRSPIPGNVRLAALELIAHWWQGSQQRSAQAASAGYDTVDQDFTRTTGITGINQGVPYRILELLKPHRHPPIIG